MTRLVYLVLILETSLETRAWLFQPRASYSLKRPASERFAVKGDEEDTIRVIAATKRNEVSDELLSKVREYLAVRSSAASNREEMAAKREAITGNPIWQMGNYLFSLESFLPKEVEVDDDIDPFDYAELARWGYSSLVEDIMDAGGRVEVSRALGIQLRPATKPEPPPPKVWRASDEPDTVGRIALGAARTDRIEDLIANPDLRPKKTPFTRNRTTKPITSRNKIKTRPLPSSRVLQEKKEVTSSPYWPLLLAPLGLTPFARVYAAVGLFSIAAQPEATATRQALSKFAESEALFEALQYISFAFLAANLAAAAITLFWVLSSSDTIPQEEVEDDVLAAKLIRALLGGPLTLLPSSSSSSASRRSS